MRIPLYGFRTWADIFTPRQLLALLTTVKWTRAVRDEMRRVGYTEEWVEAVVCYLAAVFDRYADYNSTVCYWMPPVEASTPTFGRFALPMTWDFAENNAIHSGRGSYFLSLQRIGEAMLPCLKAAAHSSGLALHVGNASATSLAVSGALVDAVVTDPPYYDAVPYSDISDFFYVWLRRILEDSLGEAFSTELSHKEEELVQQDGSAQRGHHGKAWYEAGMATAFRRACEALVPDGRMVVVFAHKNPMAWESLVTGMIAAGFTVTGSWPIDTEQFARIRARSGAALASSIWLVCRKRPIRAGVGRYAAVRHAMQERVTERLRYFWDVGIGGPDFVWAAVGPALESYSAYDEVRRLDGSSFTVSDFLREVRRMVADFALGKILHGRSTEGLDEWTRYYLMHRSYFGLDAAPIGECILLSQGYGLDLNELRGPRGFLLQGTREEEVEDGEKSSGSGLRLARWDERKRDDLGEPHAGVGLPMVDVVHRLMHLWAAGNLDALATYAAEKGLRSNDLFWEVAQAALEMAAPKSRERALLEAIVAWGRGKEPAARAVQESFLDYSPDTPSGTPDV